MDVFQQVDYEYALDANGVPAPNGWAPGDANVYVVPALTCQLCFSRIANVKQYKAWHIAWHAQKDSAVVRVKTVTGMTPLGINAEQTYTITWDTAMADTNYAVAATVTSSGAALGAIAAVVPGSITTTGCKVSVRTLGIALGSTAVLTVYGIHV
ncbi:hypothetical protein QE359_003689 [Curtobacterium sp. SORGH_AS776]|nr:hypothetical protein [Curtobacterium sp. SORGH_AS_0776]